MSDSSREQPDADGGDGGLVDGPDGGAATTAPVGTPMPVQMDAHPADRRTFAWFLAGPVIWFGHFMLVYLVGEAGCTGERVPFAALGPPVPSVVTLVATAVATAACLAVAWQERRRWQRHHGTTRARGGDAEVPGEHLAALDLVGVMLALVSAVSVLFVGLPALVLGGC